MRARCGGLGVDGGVVELVQAAGDVGRAVSSLQGSTSSPLTQPELAGWSQQQHGTGVASNQPKTVHYRP